MSLSLIRRLSAGLVVVTFAGFAADPVPAPAPAPAPTPAAAAPATVATPAKKSVHHPTHKKPVAKPAVQAPPPAAVPIKPVATEAAVPIKPSAEAVPIKPQQN